MNITIIYDNTAFDERLTADWGFACLVAAGGVKLLFDTGAKGSVLLDNMRLLNIDPRDLDMVFISHDHWDHTGGLEAVLRVHQAPVYVPVSLKSAGIAEKVVRIQHPVEIAPGMYSTGELGGVEQSLAVRVGDEIVVVAGCSHPGVGAILDAASRFGKVTGLIGGLHGFDEFDRLSSLKQICPTHCTQHIREIADRYPEAYTAGGAGKAFSLPI